MIEVEWIQGIEFFLRSQITHDIVRGLNSDERTYFIENMIGDIFEMKDEVQNVLKRELTQRPYAGILILNYTDRFDSITVRDRDFWNEACNNVY